MYMTFSSFLKSLRRFANVEMFSVTSLCRTATLSLRFLLFQTTNRSSSFFRIKNPIEKSKKVTLTNITIMRTSVTYLHNLSRSFRSQNYIPYTFRCQVQNISYTTCGKLKIRESRCMMMLMNKNNEPLFNVFRLSYKNFVKLFVTHQHIRMNQGYSCSVSHLHM